MPLLEIRNLSVDFATSSGSFRAVDATDVSVDKGEILAMANLLWRDLVKASNEGKYGEFSKNFSGSLARAIDQVVAGHQFANSELARGLSEDADALGIIRRGEHVTVLYRQRSTKKEGEWLGRLVLGYENGEVRIFGASIF